ncbi:MAG: hypothetical protein JWP76_1616 [Dactylosporangium sp.]|nr:hypothetical protein [Dactylosporangium sp.]
MRGLVGLASRWPVTPSGLTRRSVRPWVLVTAVLAGGTFPEAGVWLSGCARPCVGVMVEDPAQESGELVAFIGGQGPQQFVLDAGHLLVQSS